MNASPMIQEVIISSQNPDGTPHFAPMGISQQDGYTIIAPFRPSTTLDNITASKTAVVNYCADVRIFSGCLAGRQNFPSVATGKIKGSYLAKALAHSELEMVRIQNDKLRPQLFCKPLQEINHAPFQGFNRAQAAVLEAAILLSRVHLLPPQKVRVELEYLQIAIDKTAGPDELQAWDELMQLRQKSP